MAQDPCCVTQARTAVRVPPFVTPSPDLSGGIAAEAGVYSPGRRAFDGPRASVTDGTGTLVEALGVGPRGDMLIPGTLAWMFRPFGETDMAGGLY